MSHILFQDFCIFRIKYLGRLWYTKVFSEPLATIEQCRISFNPNTMVVNDHFTRSPVTTFPVTVGQVVPPHSIAWKEISKLNWKKILVYFSALQCKKVQSSIQKFHWSKKLRKTENFSSNLNIRVPFKSVN